MADPIYDSAKQAYLDKGLWVRRVSPGKKGCRDQNWQRAQPEVEQTAPYDGIAIMAGSPLPDGTTLGFLDVDHDGLTEAFRIWLGPKCERIGKKGTAIPVKIDGNVSNAKFYAGGGSKPLVELMAHQSIVVAPPSIHPETKKPYVWRGVSIVDLNLDDLPFIDSQKVGFIKSLIENEDLQVIMGGEGTHSAGLAMVGRLVHHIEDDSTLEKIVASILPEGYEGDSLKELPNWVKSARKKVDSGKWETRDSTFLRAKSGAIVLCAKNTIAALEKLGVKTRYDAFADQEMIKIGDEPERPNTDNIECSLRQQMDLDFGYRVPPNVFRDTMRAIALENSFHPVKDYLNSLKWDDQNRLDSWLVECSGAEDSPYVREVGKLILVAAVRRIMRPGAKFDEMPVLQSSKQGTYKSTALSVLAVRDEWFCDSFSLDQDSKTLLELSQGKWIIEISELKGLSRGGSDHVKSILSRRFDRSRMAYGRITEERPRQFVFIGTTNEKEFLRDETGNRRFWPVVVKKLDVKKLREIRDQLWAEAYQMEQNGMEITMRDDLWETMTERQEHHRVRDNPFVDILGKMIGDKDNGRISSAELLDMLDLDVGKINNAQYKTLRSAMAELGWAYKRTIRINGKVVAGGYMKGDGAEVIHLAEFSSKSGNETMRSEY